MAGKDGKDDQLQLLGPFVFLYSLAENRQLLGWFWNGVFGLSDAAIAGFKQFSVLVKPALLASHRWPVVGRGLAECAGPL